MKLAWERCCACTCDPCQAGNHRDCPAGALDELGSCPATDAAEDAWKAGDRGPSEILAQRWRDAHPSAAIVHCNGSGMVRVQAGIEPCSGCPQCYERRGRGPDTYGAAALTALCVVRHAAGDVADYIKGDMTAAAEVRLAAALEAIEQVDAAVRTDAVEAAKLRVLVERSRARWQCLADDVDRATRHREQRGGQHAGVPHLASAPPSLLARLRQDAGQALEEFGRETRRTGGR